MRLIFDRGTILCTDVDIDVRAHRDLKQVPNLMWDPRVRAYRAPAYCYTSLCKDLTHCGFDFVDEVCRVEGGNDGECRGGAGPLPQHELPSSGPELRPYQQAALAAWEATGRRGIAALPTGSGKTRLAIAAIAHTQLPTLCLVPTRILLEQWRRAISEMLHIPVGGYGDGEHTHSPVTVAPFERGYRHMAQLGSHFGLLIVDEAHHFGTGCRDEALEMATAPARLGLTATPPHDEAEIARLARLIGPTVFAMAIQDLTGSYLADFDLVSVTLDLSAGERAAYDAAEAQYKPFARQFFRMQPQASWADFIRAASMTQQGRAALRGFRDTRRIVSFTAAKASMLQDLLRRHREAKLLVFTADNETAYAVSRRHLIMPITCEIGKKERAWALSEFATGRLRALVSARVLNEGIDVPDADVAIVVGATAGEREYVQRVGRVLRPAPGKRATVFELITRATSEVARAEKRRRALGT